MLSYIISAAIEGVCLLCQEIFPQKRTLFSRHFLVVVFLVRVDLFRSRRSSLTARYGLLDGHCFPIHRRFSRFLFSGAESFHQMRWTVALRFAQYLRKESVSWVPL